MTHTTTPTTQTLCDTEPQNSQSDDRRAGARQDRRDATEQRTGYDRRAGVDRRSGPSQESSDSTDWDRRRGPGRRRCDDRRDAEEGQMNDEQFTFIMAVDAYRRANNRPFPSLTEILEILKALGYRKVAQPRQLTDKPTPDQKK